MPQVPSCRNTEARIQTMKTKKHTVPADMLSVEHKGQFIRILTHRNEIIVNIGPVGCCGTDRWMTFEDLFKLLESALPASGKDGAEGGAV